jgi:isoleucyl-tRNA synthetase
MDLLDDEGWADMLIVSLVSRKHDPAQDDPANFVEMDPIKIYVNGTKCLRCWRVLPEVGQSHAHPGLCRRCESVVTAQDAAA